MSGFICPSCEADCNLVDGKCEACGVAPAGEPTQAGGDEGVAPNNCAEQVPAASDPNGVQLDPTLGSALPRPASPAEEVERLAVLLRETDHREAERAANSNKPWPEGSWKYENQAADLLAHGVSFRAPSSAPRGPSAEAVTVAAQAIWFSGLPRSKWDENWALVDRDLRDKYLTKAHIILTVAGAIDHPRVSEGPTEEGKP